MTDANLAEQICTLHAETIAAIEQRQALAAEARSALIAALRNRLICRPGCEDALATWGLKPLPHRWTVSADAQLSHTRTHADLGEAREQARLGVPDELRRLQPAMAVYPRHVIDVTPAPPENGQPDPRRYRITVQVTVQTWVTATREAQALRAAAAIVEGHLPALADAGISLTGLRWRGADGPDDVPVDDIDTEAQPVTGTVQLTDADDLPAATAARDAAVQVLAALRRNIRTRAIRALGDDEIGGCYQRTAERVSKFLADLGLAGLPQAHHVTVIADVTLRLPAGTASEACDAARDTLRAATTDSPDETRPWTAYGWTAPEYATVDQDGWLVPWRHEYDMWLRGHTTSADATAAAEVLVRADLNRALADVEQTPITLTASLEGAGVDLYLDPDRD
ncbi:hypothetical protein GCE86_08970 [Micromonospora terminaliae]|uniref:Uncharacterized protein n=1 Tax=Micromonospora terminaliae TaxID=1914461 RepID=A0AAJ3DIR5_9ACTN|nr:hypothetical protein [Micromonospora terminaliae]NES28084.1 hypothetical protein [Micromonospora terminaliae]QGL47166.1 hypothetical protein GCE86_08970 [Micromonospora terminaliae]